MTTVGRMLDKRLFPVIALTAVLWLAGIIVLPALGPTYSDPAQAQTSDDSPAAR